MSTTNDRIALVTDSGSDLPKDFLAEHSIHTVSLKVIYNDREYDDGKDITAQEVYDRLEKEVPKTSMPSTADAINLFKSLKDQGYKKILCVHLSCNLSGTVDMMRMVRKDFEDMDIEIIDTKSVSIGTGHMVRYAAKLIKEGLDLQEIKSKLLAEIDKIKVFFCIPMLDYLRKGGRIGLVAATLGTIMDLKPIISVNEDGKYYSVAKVRGRKKSLEKLVEIVSDVIGDNVVNLAVYHGAASQEAQEIKEALLKHPNIKEVFLGHITASMAVHTGPGLVGVAVHLL